MKKLISILLACALLFALTPAVFAADAEEENAADVLFALGLFRGTGTNADGSPIYDLDRAPNRAEAVTMLVRLLGKEEEANAGAWDTPFTDVDAWAKPYVGYAYANGLTNGTGATTFSGKDPVTATQYLTFVLRALGYSSDTDFKWNAAWELTNELGITCGEYDNAAAFDRGDVVKISVSALEAYMKGAAFTLADKLMGEGVFTPRQYETAMAIQGYSGEGQNPVADYAGDYQWDRVSAHVECQGAASVIVTVRWGGSVWEQAEWVMDGPVDPATLTLSYTDCIKTVVTYNDQGDIVNEELVYDDGTGTLVFNRDGSITWHDDRSDYGMDIRLEPLNGSAEPEEDGQNPVMNFIGNYQWDRVNAHVECQGADSAIITIRWSSSVWEHAEWVIVGRLDTDTLTIAYTDCIKSVVTYNDEGEIENDELVYDDGTGTIVFAMDGSFTWHDDRSEYGTDMVLRWVPADTQPEPADGQNPAMNFIGRYVCQSAQTSALVEAEGVFDMRITLEQTVGSARIDKWTMTGPFDPDTLTMAYADGEKICVTYTYQGNDQIADEKVEYTNGSGVIVFWDNGTFTWHDDLTEQDLTFEWVPVG